MTRANKIGIIIILVGFCLPTATLPFIIEFHPQPNICLTSNFFSNLGNMVVVFSTQQMKISGADADTIHGLMIKIPYRYVFTLGIVLVCVGVGIIVLSFNKNQT